VGDALAGPHGAWVSGRITYILWMGRVAGVFTPAWCVHGV